MRVEGLVDPEAEPAAEPPGGRQGGRLPLLRDRLQPDARAGAPAVRGRTAKLGPGPPTALIMMHPCF